MPGRSVIDNGLGTYSDDLPDEDLDDEKDIYDVAVKHGGPRSRLDTVGHGEKVSNLSGHTSGHLGRTIVQRRPPRPTNSGNLARIPLVPSAQTGGPPKVQGGGSGLRRRTTRRVAATEKHWGNSSAPAITVRDIMGSEKKATAVGIVRSDHTRSMESLGKKGSKSGAEEKRTMIRSRLNEKHNRQSNVKNSLAQFLKGDQSGESDDAFQEDVEDEEIISDDEELHRHSSALSLNFVRDEDSDDGASVNSSRSHSRIHKTRRSSAKRTDGNSTDGDVPGSSQLRGRMGSRRQKKSDTTDDDDRSIGSTRSRSRSCKRTSRRIPSKHGREELFPTEHTHSHEGQKKTSARSLSVPRRSVPSSKPKAHRKKATGDEDDRSVGSRKAVSTRRRQSSGDDDDDRSVGSKKNVGRRRKPQVDDDDRSVGSRKSVGGRRRRHQSTRTKHPASQEDAPVSPRRTVKSGSPTMSPLGSKPNSASNLGETSDKPPSLALHIQGNPPSKSNTDPEDRSEESSRFSASYEQPKSLLQFDPTNPNNITMVRQDKANVTSEKIRHLDGTESELHITELAGLPTFEISRSKFNDSMSSSVSESEKRPQSARSVGSIELSDGEAPRAAKSMSHIGYSPRKAGLGTSTDSTAGCNRNVTGSRSFLVRRGRKPGDNGEKPQKSTGQEITFQESVKGFFGGWNKKGDYENGDEEDDQPKGNRFFRKRDEVEHQALDDDSSDEN